MSTVADDIVVFTPEQFYNADVYLARVIGTMAAQFRASGSGYPSGLEEDEWNAILDNIAGPLLAYAERKFDDMDYIDSLKLHKDAKTAMQLFAMWFDHFWD